MLNYRLLMFLCLLGEICLHAHLVAGEYNRMSNKEFAQVVLAHKEEFLAIAQAAKNNQAIPNIEKRTNEMIQALQTIQNDGRTPLLIENTLYGLGVAHPVNGYKYRHYNSNAVTTSLIAGIRASISTRCYIWKVLLEHAPPRFLRGRIHDLVTCAKYHRDERRRRFGADEDLVPVPDVMLRVLARTDTIEAIKFIEEEIVIRDKLTQKAMKERQAEIDKLPEQLKPFADVKIAPAKNYDIPLAVRARLLDKNLELSLIEKFRKEEDLESMAKLTEQLGEIGSPECAYALACKMRSPHMVPINSFRQPESLRILVMKALGRIYPQEPLFNEELLMELKLGYYRLTDSQKQEFYAKREKWCEKHFNIRWKTERPPFNMGVPMAIP